MISNPEDESKGSLRNAKSQPKNDLERASGGLETPSKTSPEIDGDLANTKQTSDSPGNSSTSSSRKSENIGIVDIERYIRPNEMDILLSDVQSSDLHGDLSRQLGVAYLG